jgi:hypothetical protein
MDRHHSAGETRRDQIVENLRAEFVPIAAGPEYRHRAWLEELNEITDR